MERTNKEQAKLFIECVSDIYFDGELHTENAKKATKEVEKALDAGVKEFACYLGDEVTIDTNMGDYKEYEPIQQVKIGETVANIYDDRD